MNHRIKLRTWCARKLTFKTMCGIAGYWGEGNEEVLHKMIDSISYRGPDDKGVFLKGGVGLAHRRLSIIDTSSAGHQPMSNEDGTVHIVFNGEIYNFKELRKELKGEHVFRSQTDTEVIIHLYEEIGEAVFSKLSGMFAIALFDSKRNKIILSRDRMGKKPLYWHKSEGIFIFGSELKALIAHPRFIREIDLRSLNKYFQYEYVPTPHSIFKNTYKLEPGSFLVFDGEKIVKNIFWEPTFLPKITSFEKAKEELNIELERSVKDRLVSDVPIGIFLSGGLDSSAMAYYATKVHKNKIKTFSIGFKEASFDESKFARKVSESLGTEHYEKILSMQDCIKIISKIGKNLDEPMADPSIVPTFLLSQFTREHVTVALGGDGGDELFSGYDTFLAHKFSFIYSRIPKVLRDYLVKPIVNSLPVSYMNMSLDFKLKKFIEGFDGKEIYRNERWLGAFDEKERKMLFSEKVEKGINSLNEFEDVDRYVSKSDSKNFSDLLALTMQRLYMMDEVLVKVDRSSMMNSLEVRAPFLDNKVVELANHMPEDYKLKGLTRKYILKKLLEGKLPTDIISRKKKGFGMPIGEWIRGDLKPAIEDFLSRESLEKMGLFNAEYVRNILHEHYEGKKDNRKKIWTLFVFSMWWRNIYV